MSARRTIGSCRLAFQSVPVSACSHPTPLSIKITTAAVTIGHGIKSVGYAAFRSCISLASVAIPDTVTRIDDAAFQFCDTLKNVTIGNGATNIGAATFHGCVTLTNAVIGDRVRNIGLEAFLSCFKLTTVTFGSGLTNISSRAFASCRDLAFLFFWGNRPRIGSGAFPDFGLQTYYVPWATGWAGTSISSSSARPWLLPNPVILNYGPTFGLQSNGFGFRVYWATNTAVLVEVCNDLASSHWFPIATNTLSYVPYRPEPTNCWFYFSDPQWANYPSRIYRVRSP